MCGCLRIWSIRVNWTPLSLMSKPTPRQFKYITKYAKVFSTMYYVYRTLQGCMNDYVFITNNDLQQVKFLISTYYWGSSTQQANSWLQYKMCRLCIVWVQYEPGSSPTVYSCKETFSLFTQPRSCQTAADMRTIS